MVEYEDGAVIAQLGVPDMKVPIQYALTYPKRVPNGFPKLNIFEEGSNLTFERPRIEKFPCLQLAYTSISDYTLDDVLEADKWAREYTSKIC